MARKKKKEVADQQEVLSFHTSVMRGMIPDYVVRKSAGGEEIVPVPTRLGDRMHAAEILNKYLSLPAAAEESASAAVQAVEEAVQRLGGDV